MSAEEPSHANKTIHSTCRVLESLLLAPVFDRAAVQKAGASDKNLADFRRVLGPLIATLKEQPYLCGQQPSYPDFAVAGAFAVGPLSHF